MRFIKLFEDIDISHRPVNSIESYQGTILIVCYWDDRDALYVDGKLAVWDIDVHNVIDYFVSNNLNMANYEQYTISLFNQNGGEEEFVYHDGPTNYFETLDEYLLFVKENGYSYKI